MSLTMTILGPFVICSPLVQNLAPSGVEVSTLVPGRVTSPAWYAAKQGRGRTSPGWEDPVLLRERASVDAVFGVDERDEDGVMCVAVHGELDLAAAPTLREALFAAVERGSGLIVIDLLGVTFIDSTALGVLIGTRERSDRRGIDLRLVIGEPRIIKIFEITGLSDVFSITPTVAEALTR